jgi:ABC-type Mn2+/Zn2+ transport system ATPase subunit
MKRMECLQFRERLYGTPSGGEQQRVLLAACIAPSSDVVRRAVHLS